MNDNDPLIAISRIRTMANIIFRKKRKKKGIRVVRDLPFFTHFFNEGDKRIGFTRLSIRKE